MATVYKTEFGITAFNSEDKLVMLDSRPMVNWGFSSQRLEESSDHVGRNHEHCSPLPSLLPRNALFLFESCSSQASAGAQ
jgi:hypothetical protein